MRRAVRRGLTTLAAIVILAAAQSAAAIAQGSSTETQFLRGVHIDRPHVDLDRVLRRQRLVISYSCMEACRPFMRLRVAGIAISTFNPPGGPTAGNRRAVFKLGREGRRMITGHTRRGIAAFRIAALFTNRTPARATRVLRFRLRR